MNTSLNDLAVQVGQLPPELVEPVIADLPLAAVLAISTNHPYLTECLLHSPSWRVMHLEEFDSNADASMAAARKDIQTLQDLFRLYVDVRQFTTSRKFSYTRPTGGSLEVDMLLGKNGVALTCRIRNGQLLGLFQRKLNSYVNDVVTLIWKRIPPTLSDEYLQRLLETGSSTKPNVSPERATFDIAKRVAMELRKDKHDQLMLFSDLLEKYPLLLKRALDPSQSPAAKKASHNISRLRVDAPRVLLGYASKYNFHSPCLPFVPYDRCLHVFFAILEAFPLPDGGLQPQIPVEAGTANITKQMEGLSVNDTGRKEDSLSRVYPESMIPTIRKAVDGLFSLYAFDALPNSLSRIVWSSGTEGVAAPFFKVDEYFCPYSMLYDSGPFHAHELEWLQAFLQSVAWMETEFPDLAALV